MQLFKDAFGVCLIDLTVEEEEMDVDSSASVGGPSETLRVGVEEGPSTTGMTWVPKQKLYQKESGAAEGEASASAA
eukprot:6338037-Lingulodinium_polyedra.AAC.1